MSLYENIFLVRPDVSAAQVETMAKEFSDVIENGGGTVPKTEFWGLKNLAYRIKKNRKAHYVLINIDTPHEALHEMERQMGLHEDVMRHMTIRVDELEEGPSAVMQSKNSRDERRPRRDDRPRDEAPREAAPVAAEPAAKEAATEAPAAADKGEAE
jgi:small subunit ribosomal protein S6